MDKRQFQRVDLKVPGELSLHGNSIPVTIEDVSLQGLRLSAAEAMLEMLPFDSYDPYTVMFKANPDSPLITLYLQQLYRQSQGNSDLIFIGCKVDHVEVECLAELRTLINLNSGDPGLSEQDLNALIDAVYKKDA
ncbi:PilZ domain-containing protein [Alteromonas confluentis]|uniref:PilZ domain-containing protein n=1 Tax=Alteromonas confluentis TaxID=1656094 RepID=A0A1E7Z7M5_9ALTE|nr:PilZ domain-containing protein [Alteromonas confluentis]OFC69549.1 hypothetical protein BFC18_17660 [Alteromonas confluentis]